jgi:hypothetical protein
MQVIKSKQISKEVVLCMIKNLVQMPKNIYYNNNIQLKNNTWTNQIEMK